MASQIRINDGFAKVPATAITEVIGEFETLDVEKWQQVLQDNVNTGEKISLNIKTEQLQLWGNDFNDISFVANPYNDGWFVEVDGATMAGKLTFYPLQIYVNLERLYLSRKYKIANTSDSEMSPFKLNLSVDDLHWGDLAMGDVSFKVVRSGKKTRFKQVHISNELFSLEADGVSDFEDKRNTKFSGSLVCNDVDKLLTAFGKDNVVSGGRGDIVFNVSWPQAIGNFALEKIAGEIELKFADGYLESINPGFGRVLSLLSIDNIGRRLKLDFSDVTGKGFAFDKIDGMLTLENSKLTTTDVRILGPAANIYLQGNMALDTKILDMLAIVNPKITASLPIAAALAVGNPVVGATMWVVDKLLSPQIF